MQAVKGANNSRQGQQASNSFPFFSNDLGQGGSSTVGEVKTRTNTFCSFQFSIFSSTIWIDLLVVFIFSCFRSTYRQFSIVFKWVMTRGFDQTMGVSFPVHLSHNIPVQHHYQQWSITVGRRSPGQLVLWTLETGGVK